MGGDMFGDPSLIDQSLGSRAITFENPSGATASAADTRLPEAVRVLRVG